MINSINFNHTFPIAITVNNETISNPSAVVNAFNNSFAKVAKDIQSSLRFSQKKYFGHLSPLSIESFFITSPEITEVSKIIFSINEDKSDGTISIPTKILKLLNKNISRRLAILFNQSFSSGICSSVLKTNKITPIYKTFLNQNVQTIDQFHYYLTLTKFWKDLYITDFTTFQKKKTFSLQFDFQQKYSTNNALIYLTDKIRQEINKSNCTCEIFVDFQKNFETVDHYILLEKLEHYGFRGISNKQFAFLSQ